MLAALSVGSVQAAVASSCQALSSKAAMCSKLALAGIGPAVLAALQKRHGQQWGCGAVHAWQIMSRLGVASSRAGAVRLPVAAACDAS